MVDFNIAFLNTSYQCFFYSIAILPKFPSIYRREIIKYIFWQKYDNSIFPCDQLIVLISYSIIINHKRHMHFDIILVLNKTLVFTLEHLVWLLMFNIYVCVCVCVCVCERERERERYDPSITLDVHVANGEGCRVWPPRNGVKLLPSKSEDMAWPRHQLWWALADIWVHCQWKHLEAWIHHTSYVW